MNIDDFNFHDSILKEIIIERNNPGYRDEVKIKIGFLDGNNIEVIFEDCFKAIFDLNFGIIAEETIFDFYRSTENDNELKILKEKWLNIGGSIEGLSLFCIETNSTKSMIKIYARDYKIETSVRS